MKTIKSSSKKGQHFICAFNRSNYRNLYDCYNRPSTNKTRADYLCRQMAINEDGEDYRIISYNCDCFTVGWKTEDGLRIETARNSYLITD